jgi:pimeloyl-ACP methyl ester carboxylesterase
VITPTKINHTTRRGNPMNQSNEARRSARMIGRVFLSTLASLALLVPAGNAPAFSDGQRHGCGVLVDAGHPWRSHVPGGNVETGAAIANPRNPQHAASRYITTLRAAGSQNRILAKGVKGFKALFVLGGGGIPATIVDAYARALATPAALGAAIDWYRANPFPTPRLGPIKVPTLYLWGAKDAVFLRSTANATAAYVEAPYTSCVLPGRGHWLPEDAAPQIIAPLLSQLAGSRSRCPSISATHHTH